MQFQNLIYETPEPGEAASIGIASSEKRMARERGIGRVLVPSSPNPEIIRRVAALRLAMPDVSVETVGDTPFVTPTREPDLGRFFRYWNKVRKSAMRPHGV